MKFKDIHDMKNRISSELPKGYHTEIIDTYDLSDTLKVSHGNNKRVLHIIIDEEYPELLEAALWNDDSDELVDGNGIYWIPNTVTLLRASRKTSKSISDSV